MNLGDVMHYHTVEMGGQCVESAGDRIAARDELDSVLTAELLDRPCTRIAWRLGRNVHDSNVAVTCRTSPSRPKSNSAALRVQRPDTLP